MKDIECPYCGKEQDICHDDGQGYEEDCMHEQECGYCSKIFVYTTSISFYYEVFKADCLNGDEHKYKKMKMFPQIYPDARRCIVCGYEDLGERLSEEEITRLLTKD